jgi:hypothetical protein
MSLDGVGRDAESGGDLFVDQAISQERENLPLTIRQWRALAALTRPVIREPARGRAISTTSADGGTSALVAPTPTSSNSGLVRSAAASDARSFSDGATMATLVIVAMRSYAAR